MQNRITNVQHVSVSPPFGNELLCNVVYPEYVEPNLDCPVVKMLMRLPFFDDWVQFKGEIYYAQFSFDASKNAKRPMMDMFYCATQCLNNAVLFTTQWDKNKFKQSHLSNNSF